MIGWRARLGFLVPPGNPTVETEMIELAPRGVSLHFQRMVARGVGGALDGQSERNQMMIDHLDESIELLAMVQPDVIVIAHTATSYHLGREKETALLGRLQEASGTGMPTLPVLEMLEQDLGKPAISSASAMMWHALRSAGVRQPIPGYGRLLTLE